MNDTGGGVTAIHDVPGDITRIGFHWMLLFFLSVTRRVALLFCLHTECLGGHGVSFLSRIIELSNFFTRRIAEVTGFFFVPNIFLVPNFRISELFLHTECRGIIFFITRLVLGPTDQREVIIELSNVFHTECRGGHVFFVPIFRIIELLLHTEFRGVSRFFYPETCPWTH